jgi:hypothetical protein
MPRLNEAFMTASLSAGRRGKPAFEAEKRKGAGMVSACAFTAT